MPAFVGVDLGATHVRVAVAPSAAGLPGGEGPWVPPVVDRRPTPRDADGAAVTEAVLESCRAACATAGLEPSAVAGVGVGSIGPLDRAADAVVGPANLPTDRIELAAPLESLTDAPVSLCNDAVAGLRGERAAGHIGCSNAVYLTISTGIGAGALVDGHVLAGRDGNAGELGHVVVEPAGTLRCGCGGTGHWEAYSAGAGIPRFAVRLANEHETALDVDAHDFDAAAVFAAAGEDALADRVLDRVARYNAVGVATIVHAYAPEVVSLGGGVALANAEVILAGLRERLPEFLVGEPPALRTSPLGGDAVLAGALASAADVADEPA